VQTSPAEHSSQETPCTNRPVACGHCELVVASYSMAQHYAEKHSTTSMPAELATTVALEKHERAHVMQLLGKRSVSSVCGGLSCCPKAKKPKKQ
jgi:hypothetical protein